MLLVFSKSQPKLWINWKEFNFFLWTRTESKNRLHLVAWNQVCFPKLMGGLDIQNLRDFNKTLMSKQLWRCLKETNEWTDIFKLKYHIPNIQNTLETYELPNAVISGAISLVPPKLSCMVADACLAMVPESSLGMISGSMQAPYQTLFEIPPTKNYASK